VYRHGSETEADEMPGGFERFARPLVRCVHTIAYAYQQGPEAFNSPIELILATALQSLIVDRAEGCWLVGKQYRIRPHRYRFDLAVFSEPDGLLRLLIECDGWRNHHKPEDLERDAHKDAVCEGLGIPLLRFSGREIHRDAPSCAARCWPYLEADL
jgi:very-short-patch-repair endonuclease